MTYSNPSTGKSTPPVRRFVLIAVVIAALAAGAIFFAPGMFADSSPSPAASNAAAVSGAWSDAGAGLAGRAASARVSFRDAGASAPLYGLAAVQLRNAASAPLLAAPVSGYRYAETSPAALALEPASGYRYADSDNPSDNVRFASYSYSGARPAASLPSTNAGSRE